MKNNYLIAILLFFNFCFSQDGTLDLTFLADHRESRDGEGVIKEFGPFKPGTIYSKLVQPDGKILIGGDFRSYNGHPKISIARLNADGTVDNAFIARLGHSDILRSMDLQSDGKIIIVGDLSTDAYPELSMSVQLPQKIRRLNNNGTVDISFNPNGIGANNPINSVVVQPDGKILIAGDFTSYNNIPAKHIARLNSDGTLDISFSQGTGFMYSSTPNTNTTVKSILLQPDGKIIVGGNFLAYNNTPKKLIVRLNADGSLDTSFNPGAQFADGTQNIVVNSIALQQDGKIIVGGDFKSYNGTIYGVARLNIDGSIDTNFNPDPSSYILPHKIVLQQDGKIIIGGGASSSLYANNPQKKITRLNNDGSTDTSFNPGPGARGDYYSVRCNIFSLAVQQDGKILIGGFFRYYNNIQKASLVRANSDGSTDLSFNPGSGMSAKVTCSIVQPDGKIIIGGAFTNYNENQSKRIVRLNPDSTIDTSFNIGSGFESKATPPVSYDPHNPYFDGHGNDCTIQALCLQADGKILVSGDFFSFNGIAKRFIIRLNSDGSLDSSFNFATPQEYPEGDVINTIAVQPDGKILIAVSNNTSNIKRLNADGSEDSTFSVPPISNVQIKSIVVQNDGKIVIGGSFSYYYSIQKSILRLNSDGSVDTSFNHGGLNFYENINQIALQRDGKIIIAGKFNNYSGVSGIYNIARLNTDGTLDLSFYRTDDLGEISTVSIQSNGKIIVCGNSMKLARLFPNGSLDSEFNNILNSSEIARILTTSIQPDGKIIVGGEFNTYSGIPRNRIARLLNDDDALTVPDYSIAKLTIYPNPANSFLNLRLPDNQSAEKIIITDIVGKIVMPITFISNNRVNIEKLTTGLYIIKAFTNEGEFQSKFIKN